jgi:hypothetical protein
MESNVSVWKIVSDNDWAGLGEDYQEHIHIPAFIHILPFQLSEVLKTHNVKRLNVVV